MLSNITKSLSKSLLRPINNKINSRYYNHYSITRKFFGPFKKSSNDPKANLSYEDKREQEHIEEIESFKNMENLSSLVENAKKETISKFDVCLPPKKEEDQGKITVCVELDDIFLHAYFPDEYEGYLFRPSKEEDYYIDLPEYNTDLHLYKRDNCDEFLEYLANECEAVLYATGSKTYVDKVIDIFDRDRKIFKHRLYQEHCTLVEFEDDDLKELVKVLDTEYLGRDEKRTVLLDTKYLCFWPNPDNAIPVTEYKASKKEDIEL